MQYFIYNNSYVCLKTDSLRADHCRSSMLANSFAERCLSMLQRCFKFGTRLRFVLGQHISLVEFMHSVQSLKTWRKMYSLWILWLSSKISNIYWNMCHNIHRERYFRYILDCYGSKNPSFTHNAKYFIGAFSTFSKSSGVIAPLEQPLKRAL